MDIFEKINPLSADNRELLSNLKYTFDLGTLNIIERDEDEISEDLSDLI